ncbi:MAG: manganese efflux pump [Bacillota bacterium]|nr:manganese efflux pump [Bacillota bacterium]
MITPLLLALAVSFDSLFAGMTYGFRNIRLTPAAYLIIGMASGVLMLSAVTAGEALGTLMPSELAACLGALTLLGLGVWHLAGAWRLGVLRPDTDSETPLARFRLPPLGIVVEILRDPLQADLDHSGRIDSREAGALGLALGLDAFAAGLSAGVGGVGLSVVPPVLLACPGFVAAGQLCGQALGNVRPLSRWPWTAVPGALLVCLGLVRL